MGCYTLWPGGLALLLKQLRGRCQNSIEERGAANKNPLESFCHEDLAIRKQRCRVILPRCGHIDSGCKGLARRVVQLGGRRRDRPKYEAAKDGGEKLTSRYKHHPILKQGRGMKSPPYGRHQS